MSWLNKFQQGGQALQVLSQISNLVQKAAQGDGNAAQEVANLVKNGDPQLMSMIQNASPDLYQAMQQIAEQVTSMMRKGGKLDYIHSLKCGGKTKKKENGGKAVRASKCGCMLKRVGGRIVEIDTCTGKMKNGGSINKFLMGSSIYFVPTASDQVRGKNTDTRTPDQRVQSLELTRFSINEIPPYFLGNSVLNAVLTQRPYNEYVYGEGSYWSPFNLYSRKPLYDLNKVAAYTLKLEDDRVRNIINLLRPGYFGSETAPVPEDHTVNIVEKPKNTINIDNWRTNFKSGGNSRYNGLTYDEGLARQLEMRQAMANGWKPSAFWGEDDGKFGKKTAAAWEEYQAWKLALLLNKEKSETTTPAATLTSNNTTNYKWLNNYGASTPNLMIDHSGVGEVPYATLTPAGEAKGNLLLIDTHTQYNTPHYSRSRK